MKRAFKYLFSIATVFAMVAMVGCNKNDNPNKGNNNNNNDPMADGYLEYNIRVTPLDQEVIVLDVKKDVLAAFAVQDIDEQTLFEAMGDYTDGTANVGGIDGVNVANQTNNTVEFVAMDPTTGYPGAAQYTCAGFDWFGWWFSADGAPNAWANSVLGLCLEFRENIAGEDAEEAQYVSADEWNIRLWSKGVAAGDKVTVEMVFVAGDYLYTKKEYYELHMKFNVEFVDAVAKDFNVIETVKTSLTVPYNTTYTPTVVDYDYASIAAKLGVENAFDCDIYYVNADGTFGLIPSTDNWFDAEGNCSGWGDNAVVDLKYDVEVDENAFSIFCMPYNGETQTAADKCGTFVVRNAFVNDKNDAVVFEVTVTVEGGEEGGEEVEE